MQQLQAARLLLNTCSLRSHLLLRLGLLFLLPFLFALLLLLLLLLLFGSNQVGHTTIIRGRTKHQRYVATCNEIDRKQEAVSMKV